jgi:anti-sigma regulatory factor (Ser/Thr protein kinase)
MEEIRLPLDHGTPASAARRTADQALQAWNLSHRRDDVLLVTTELVQNVTQHTDDGGELCLSLRPDSILIEVADTSADLPQEQAEDVRSLGGRGIRLIAAVACRWGARPTAWAGHKGKTVWAELSRRLSG